MGSKRHLEFRERVGARIRARRRELGLSQGAVARRLEGTVEGSQISRWERGESFPTYANIVQLARALEVSEEQLMCGCEPAPARRRSG